MKNFRVVPNTFVIQRKRVNEKFHSIVSTRLHNTSSGTCPFVKIFDQQTASQVSETQKASKSKMKNGQPSRCTSGKCFIEKWYSFAQIFPKCIIEIVPELIAQMLHSFTRLHRTINIMYMNKIRYDKCLISAMRNVQNKNIIPALYGALNGGIVSEIRDLSMSLGTSI